jgi:EcoRII C terminal
MTKRGLLSDCFTKVASKKLSAVEANPKKSNQHEFNGSEPLKRMFGLEDKKLIAARFLWLNDHSEGLTEDGFVTWYESRQPPRSEYRLYYVSNSVTSLMQEGDTLFLGIRPGGQVYVIVTPANSEIGHQVAWLFGLSTEPGLTFETNDLTAKKDETLDFAARFILDDLGLDLELPEAEYLDRLLGQIGEKLPRTQDFSEFVRKQLEKKCSALDEPDSALMSWLDLEEKLFRRHEHFRIAARLDKGFKIETGTDVEGFLSFSLSVQNARKSRMGLSLEHHMAAILEAHGIKFSRGAVTEHNNRPDFLFPGIKEYKDLNFQSNLLRMLASKSTCKDRWRQVLSEAVRIEKRHLLTLEPSISQNQTDEMKAKFVQLVIPNAIHDSYNKEQRDWLMTVGNFLSEIKRL